MTLVPRIPRQKPDPLMDEIERAVYPTDQERRDMAKKIRDELAKEGNRIDEAVRRKR